MPKITRSACPDCGETTLIDASLKIGVDRVYVEAIFHKWFQSNSSFVTCKVCSHCGRIFLYAEDLTPIRRALQ